MPLRAGSTVTRLSGRFPAAGMVSAGRGAGAEQPVRTSNITSKGADFIFRANYSNRAADSIRKKKERAARPARGPPGSSTPLYVNCAPILQGHRSDGPHLPSDARFIAWRLTTRQVLRCFQWICSARTTPGSSASSPKVPVSPRPRVLRVAPRGSHHRSLIYMRRTPIRLRPPGRALSPLSAPQPSPIKADSCPPSCPP